MNASSSKTSSSNPNFPPSSAGLPLSVPDAAHFEQMVIGKGARPKPHRLLPLLCVTLVLSAGTYVVLRRSRMNVELRLAVMQHDIVQVRRLLAWGADPDTRYEGQSPDESSFWNGFLPNSAPRPPSTLTRTHKTLLMTAVTSGHSDVVAALLAHGADVNAQLPNGQTPLLFATSSRSPAIAPMLLGWGAHWNVRDGQGRSPFLNAAEAGNLEAVREILGRGANIEETDADQQSALCLASAKRHEDVVELLLARGAGIDSLEKALINPAQYRTQRSGNGFVPPGPPQTPILLWAAGVGSPSLLTVIWDKHTNDREREQQGPSALNMAVQSGSEATVRALLMRNVPAEPTLPAGTPATVWPSTPLANAAGVHNLPLVRLLLERGARVNPAQDGQYTPLMAAAAGNTTSYFSQTNASAQINTEGNAGVQTVQLLLAHGAKVNAHDGQGKTPLMCALNSPQVAKILIECGADVNARDHQLNTALLQAYNPDVIKLLIEHGADAHGVDRSGMPLLTRISDPALFALLIAKGANVNAPDFAGSTPLMHSMSDKITTLLLNNGANVNARDKQDFTALHSAVRMQLRTCIPLLIQHGADVNAVDKTGQTPLSLAKQSHQQPVIDALVAAGATH